MNFYEEIERLVNIIRNSSFDITAEEKEEACKRLEVLLEEYTEIRKQQLKCPRDQRVGQKLNYLVEKFRV